SRLLDWSRCGCRSNRRHARIRIQQPDHAMKLRSQIDRLLPRSARRLVPVARRRIATALGAVLLGLVALVFAALGDRLQLAQLQIVHHWPYAPLILTPLIFAGTAWITCRWFAAARGSGIPQVIAAAHNPEG